MSRAIVLGYDGSSGGEAALAAAIDLARDTGDRLLVVYGFQPPERISGEEFQAHQQALLELGEATTARAVARAAAAGVDAQAVLVPERPVSALVEEAERCDARLIVVGTYDEGTLRSLLLGSTPLRLVQAAGRPVLVVPEPRDG